MVSALLAGVGLSALCGLDRTAAFQFMLARPIVAAPLTGLCLGDVRTGLLVGILVELLWLGRLPMGAAIPPDDTQIAVAATFLAVAFAAFEGVAGPGFTVLATLVALPLGKVGQFFERWARHRNELLVDRAERAIAEGDFARIDVLHLRGLFNFLAASVGTFLVIVACGGGLLHLLSPLALPFFAASAEWLCVFIPLAGVAGIVGNIHVNRSLTLFGSSFVMVFLLLWLL